MPKAKAKPLIVQATQAQTGHPLKNLLLIYLADYCGDGITPSQAEMAARCCASRAHINRMLKELEADGWILKKPIYSACGARTANEYQIIAGRLA